MVWVVSPEVICRIFTNRAFDVKELAGTLVCTHFHIYFTAEVVIWAYISGFTAYCKSGFPIESFVAIWACLYIISDDVSSPMVLCYVGEFKLF